MGNKKPSPNVPQREQLMIENLAGSTHADIGLTYSYRLRLQHRKHFLEESFEITPTDSECDVILCDNPYVTYIIFNLKMIKQVKELS
jgi:hypothetical protein